MRILLTVALVSLIPNAPSGADEDIDAEVARRHFDQGSQLYAAARYDEALAEFQRAMISKPLPAFHYNIALCFERLERYGEAITAYQAYLAARPADDEATRLRARIEELSRRQALLAPTASKAPAPSRSLRIAAWVLIAGALGLIAGGAIAEGVARSRFDDAQQHCKPNCTDAQVADITRPESAGYALVGIGGAAALASVIVFVLERRHARARVTATAGGLAVQF
jgi:tetratricopeptide (TPR) repeat protein